MGLELFEASANVLQSPFNLTALAFYE